MKTRTLLTTCTLAAFLAACNNEDFMTDQTINGSANETGEVIGADLASKGMTIVMEGVNTRVSEAGKWENSDRFGFGWFQFSRDAMTTTQSKEKWEGSTDWIYTYNKIYANHIFTTQDEGATWNTTSDVYQGAYFAYFPYQSLGGIVEKTFDVNSDPQTEEFKKEAINKAFHITAQKFVSTSDVDANGELTISLSPVPVVNAIYTNATPEKAIVDDEVLSGMTITQLQINAGTDDKVFAQEVTLVPSRLPKQSDGMLAEETRDDVFVAADNSTKVTNRESFLKVNNWESSLTTKVKSENFTLKNAHGLRAFALPTKDNIVYQADENPSAVITVGRLGKYELGQFAINAENSPKYISTLKSQLDGSISEEYKALTKVLRKDGKWGYQSTGMDANLTLADFTLTSNNITSLEQWNDLVSVCNALVANDYNFATTPTFTLTAEVTFEAGKIQVPECGAILATEGDGKMIIDKETEWPEALEADGKAVVVVNKGATLTFDPSKAAEIDADITNHGTIKAGQFASISTDAANKLDNTDGRVIVEYGAYIYPTVSKEGVIAYEVTANNATEIGHINQLIATSDQKGYASVNTLIVKTELDLNAKAGSDTDGDRYEEGTTSGNLSSLEEIDIELNGGKVIYTTGTNNKVNNVISIDGENAIEDIQPMGDITVKGGILNIDTKPFPSSKNLSLIAGKSVNALAGKLNVNTTVYATSVASMKGSEIVVAENEVLYYIGQNFEHAGTTTGKIESTDNSKATTVKESFALLLENPTAITTSPQDFVNGVNGNKGNTYVTLDSYVGFYCVFNAWLESIGEPALIDGETYNDLTVEHLTKFETLTGYTFEWGN